VKGYIAQTISATGTVNPVTIVNVGSQVTGKVLKLFADFNSIVKKGDIVAKIDPELYKSDIEEGEARLKTARANLKSISKAISYAESKVKIAGAEIQKAMAGLAYAQKEYERYVELFTKDLVRTTGAARATEGHFSTMAKASSGVKVFMLPHPPLIPPRVMLPGWTRSILVPKPAIFSLMLSLAP
jgi:HlyD family secretion protein